MKRLWIMLIGLAVAAHSQAFPHRALVHLDAAPQAQTFPLVRAGHAASIYVDAESMPALGAAVEAFQSDVERVSGVKPALLTRLPDPLPPNLVVVGVLGHSPWIDQLSQQGQLHTDTVTGKWESAVTSVVAHPSPGVRSALVIVGSDRRGAMFALFSLSRQMGVSPWSWWADVPIPHHAAIDVEAKDEVQAEPSVRYRGIFLNDEDWGLRPWAAQTLDRATGNIGPRTYERVFELLLRLHANTLWPAMHPGTLPFNAVPENAKLADKWGIIMGSSHSEALLRNNVGEWNEKTDGPWNYQTNRAAIDQYWKLRLEANGKFDNLYTVGMRGVHDSGLEATGSVVDKARLVEEVLQTQRSLLKQYVNPDLLQVPQVLWLYKESLELYRAGMRIPDDVTLGWTDDNYGYIRQLPNAAEQQRSGGSAVYYHVSYWGFPHDYLWLCSTPPTLIREEMSKAFDHGARRAWILNVGDIKPAEADIDYFLQLAWDEPATVRLDQKTYLERWASEQFPPAQAHAIAGLMQQYYELNFVRKPEFMGFNGYDDAVRLTEFNPRAWPKSDYGQNGTRLRAWQQLARTAQTVAAQMPPTYRNAFFELVEYPIAAAAAQNEKFLYTDRTYLDAADGLNAQRLSDTDHARQAFDRIQQLTAQHNALENGKWRGMMSSSPRDRQVFHMPPVAADNTKPALPPSWRPDRSIAHPELAQIPGFVEQHGTVSINAAHFTREFNGTTARWRVLSDLGITPSGSVTYGYAGALANADKAAGQSQPWLEYDFTTASGGPAMLSIYLLPTFPLDSSHQLRFSVSVDGRAELEINAAGSGEWHEGNAPTWEQNVLRNAAVFTLPVPQLAPGKHRIRLTYRDPGVVFEYVVLAWPGAPPTYPVPPETRNSVIATKARSKTKIVNNVLQNGGQ
ncbi:MAG: glycosyl hydrolase 115 family protein [Terracidiphilus sp.]|nr:glycosyl hydrolase 115 family protein [Terracidiphilus sp.]